MSALADRFASARSQPPLAGASPTADAELRAILARATAFEDLPGKWQAALLQAEAAAAGAGPPPARTCCGSMDVTPPATGEATGARPSRPVVSMTSARAAD